MLTRSLTLFGCFILAWGLVLRVERPEPVPPRATFDRFPMDLGEWRGVPDKPLAKNVAEVLHADDYLTRSYFTPDRAMVGLFIGYYGSQRQGDTMHSPLNCLPGAGWQPLSKTTLTVPIETEVSGTVRRDLVVNRYVIEKGLERQLVLYWYQSHGRVVASEYWSKFYLIRDAVRLNRTDGALVRVIAPIVGSEGETGAEQVAVRFVTRLFPSLGEFLPT